MCVVERLEHTCFVKNGKWDLNVTKGKTVEVQKLSTEQKNKFLLKQPWIKDYRLKPTIHVTVLKRVSSLFTETTLHLLSLV